MTALHLQRVSHLTRLSASEGLKKGLPALKLILTTESELDSLVDYIRALSEGLKLPSVNVDDSERKQEVSVSKGEPIRVDVSSMPLPKPPAPRRIDEAKGNCPITTCFVIPVD